MITQVVSSNDQIVPSLTGILWIDINVMGQHFAP